MKPRLFLAREDKGGPQKKALTPLDLSSPEYIYFQLKPRGTP